jgi:hypothetical protein
MLDNAGGHHSQQLAESYCLALHARQVQKKSNGTWPPVEIIISGFLSAKEKPLTPRIH